MVLSVDEFKYFLVRTVRWNSRDQRNQRIDRRFSYQLSVPRIEWAKTKGRDIQHGLVQGIHSKSLAVLWRRLAPKFYDAKNFP